jgi:hypothetical protein
MGLGYHYCPPSYSKFRRINFNSGSYMIYEDTLVFSDKLVTFDLWLNGRQNYACQIKPEETISSSDTIIIKLPDVARGIDMLAIATTNDTIPSRYDSLTNYFYMAIPVINKEFTIKEKE